METYSSSVTGDVVIICTLDWFLKRNLTIFTSYVTLMFTLQAADGKL